MEDRERDPSESIQRKSGEGMAGVGKLSVHQIEQWSCFLQRGSPSRVVDWRFRDNPQSLDSYFCRTKQTERATHFFHPGIGFGRAMG